MKKYIIGGRLPCLELELKIPVIIDKAPRSNIWLFLYPDRTLGSIIVSKSPAFQEVSSIIPQNLYFNDKGVLLLPVNFYSNGNPFLFLYNIKDNVMFQTYSGRLSELELAPNKFKYVV